MGDRFVLRGAIIEAEDGKKIKIGTEGVPVDGFFYIPKTGAMIRDYEKFFEIKKFIYQVTKGEVDFEITNKKSFAHFISGSNIIQVNKEIYEKSLITKGRDFTDARIKNEILDERNAILSIILHELGHYYVQKNFKLIYWMDNFFRTIVFNIGTYQSLQKLAVKLYKWLPEEIFADLTALYLLKKHKEKIKRLGV